LPLRFRPFPVFWFLHAVIMRSFLDGVIRYLAHRFLTMKRDDRQKVKADVDQRHADPNQTKAADHERHVSGNINVSGEIEAKRPPDLTQEHKTERKEDAAQAAKSAAETAASGIAESQKQFRTDERPISGPDQKHRSLTREAIHLFPC